MMYLTGNTVHQSMVSAIYSAMTRLLGDEQGSQSPALVGRIDRQGVRGGMWHVWVDGVVTRAFDAHLRPFRVRRVYGPALDDRVRY